MAKERKKMSTLHKRNALRFGKYALKTTSYAAPVVPVGIEVGMNFDEWFIKNNQGIHVAFGFIMLIFSTVLTYLSIAKHKKLFEKYSAFWQVALILICWAVAFLFLSSILNQLGMMLLYIGLSLIASATADEVDNHVIEEKLTFYQGLVSEYGLDKREVRRKEKKEEKIKQAKLEAELESRKQAID